MKFNLNWGPSSLDDALWQMLFAKADWVTQVVVPYYLH